MPAIFDLRLVNLAGSVCRDEATVSDAYAAAMGVDKGVLDAELARIVLRLPAAGGVPEEPDTLALSPDGLFLRRQRLLLELHAVGRRSFPWKGQRAILRAMQALGVESLGDLGEVGDAASIASLVGGVPGLGRDGWKGHHHGALKNGDNLLHASEALVAHAFSQRMEKALLAAAAEAANPEAVPAAPVVPFQDRLVAAGYAGMHVSCRPTVEMVEVALAKAKSTKRVIPYLDTRLPPWKNPQWSKGKDEAERLTARAAEMASELGSANVGQALITGAALAQAGKDLGERQLIGSWLASLSRVVHTLAVAGCFGDGGLSVASGYLSLITHLVASRSPTFAQVYDAKLRQQAASTEEMSAADARDLFHGQHLPTIHEAIVDCPIDRQQGLAHQQTAPRQQQTGGMGPPPAKRQRQDQRQPPRSVAPVPAPKAEKGGGKAGAPGKGAPGKGGRRPRGGQRGGQWKP